MGNNVAQQNAELLEVEWPNDPQGIAKAAVRKTILDNLEKTDPVPEFEVYVVWFCFILGGFKALLSSTISDGRYYEATYNKNTGELYIDTYVKIQNRAFSITK